MAEQFIHKYVLEFGQPVSFYEVNPIVPVTDELAGSPDYRAGTNRYLEQNTNGIAKLANHNMSFSVTKGKDASTDTNITIYNISDTVRKFLEQNNGKKPNILLKAGYETDKELPIIFAGEVILVVDTFDGNTRKTSLTCASGTNAIQEAYSAKAYRSGTKLSEVFMNFVKDMKLPEGTISFPTPMTEVNKKPIVYTGPTIEFLRKFAKENDMRVWIEDGLINAAPNDLINVSYAKAFEINSDMNMIGAPSVETADSSQSEQSSGNRQNVTVTTTLNGAYTIGGKVKLKGKYHSGVYEIESVTHQGTYEGSDWSSSLGLKPVDGWEK